MMRLASLNFPVPVFSAPDLVRSEWMAERIDETLSAKDRFANLLQRLPLPLRSDDATLERIVNLVEPVDDRGLKGSYAGWITRAALGEAAVRGDEAALVSLMSFFSLGGSLAELERRAAAVLGPVGPLRQERRERLLESDDPLKSSKLAELSDDWFVIQGSFTPNGADALREEQAAAYLGDSESLKLVRRILGEGPGLIEEQDARVRDLEARKTLKKVLSGHKPGERFWPHQVKRAFRGLGDPVSLAAAGRIGRDYRLVPAPDKEFERRVLARREKEGHRDFLPPSTQQAVFFDRSVNGEAALYARTRHLHLPWDLEPDQILRAVLEGVVHEDRHFLDFARPVDDRFSLEFRGHAEGFLWSALHGDPRDLRRFTVEQPLGPGLAFRDYYEATY